MAKKRRKTSKTKAKPRKSATASRKKGGTLKAARRTAKRAVKRTAKRAAPRRPTPTKSIPRRVPAPAPATAPSIDDMDRAFPLDDVLLPS